MTTLNLQVGASSGDAHGRVSDGVMDLTNNYLYHASMGVPYHAGIWFTGVSGLAGATISAAVITHRAGYIDDGAFEGDWFAHDAEAPGTFTTTAHNIRDRPRTTATCEGDNADFGNWVTGNDYEFTGDGVNYIKDIIQELADDYDPSAIALLHIYTSGSGERVAVSYDQVAATAPKLDIDYTAGAGGVTVVAALATASALSYASTITTGLVVVGALATATALALAAKHVNSIPAAVATATAKSYAATVSGVAVVAGALATAAAKSYDATVSGAALVGAALSTATAKSYAAVINPGVVVSAAVATASALVRAATIAAESAAGVTSSFLRWLR